VEDTGMRKASKGTNGQIKEVGMKVEGDIKEEDLNNQQWRKRDNENVQRQDYYKGQQLHLRHNLNQTREQEKHDRRQDGFKAGTDGNREGGKNLTPKNFVAEAREGKGVEEGKTNPGICKRCGNIGHKSKECFKPLVCPRCKKEGHVARAFPETLPWECIAPFCGLAAPDLGFHVIQDDDNGEATKDTVNIAVITIREGM
jgi:hypothetical protein